MMAYERRRSSSRARDHLDKAALGLAFLIGVVGILALKLSDLSPFWVAGWAAAVLVAYVAAAWVVGQLVIEPEAIGDNAYYLGFLFTLTSLSVTLYQLVESADQTGALREIVSGFGIALSSTIVGIFLRVLLMQVRPDIVARDREARIELQQAARDFRAELFMSIATIKEFTTQAHQLAAEQGSKIGVLTDGLVEAQRARVENETKLHAELLKKAVENAADQIAGSLAASIKGSGKAAQAEVAIALGELSNAVTEFAKLQREALAAQQARDAAATRESSAALARVGLLVEEIETLAGRMGSALGSISEELSEGTAALIEARRTLAEAAGPSDTDPPPQAPVRSRFFAGARGLRG
jgi:hypothetical protein